MFNIKPIFKASRIKLLWNGEVAVDIFEKALDCPERIKDAVAEKLVEADLLNENEMPLPNGFFGEWLNVVMPCREDLPWKADEIWISFEDKWRIYLMSNKDHHSARVHCIPLTVSKE